eukprot:8866271-Ditylum_brightwellii.AAC.1
MVTESTKAAVEDIRAEVKDYMTNEIQYNTLKYSPPTRNLTRKSCRTPRNRSRHTKSTTWHTTASTQPLPNTPLLFHNIYTSPNTKTGYRPTMAY